MPSFSFASIFPGASKSVLTAIRPGKFVNDLQGRSEVRHDATPGAPAQARTQAVSEQEKAARAIVKNAVVQAGERSAADEYSNEAIVLSDIHASVKCKYM